MAEVSEEDAERLANRLAMMVSEEGEAANAGRAVAQLARRLGLTGGELKEMFLHGAVGGPRPAAQAAAGSDQERQEREIAVLRKGLRLMETNFRDLEHDRDAMARELEGLRMRVQAARSSSQIRFILLGVLTLAVAGAAAVGWLVTVGDGLRPVQPVSAGAGATMAVPGPLTAATSATSQPDFGPVVRRVGVIKTERAVAYRQPDRSAPPVATLQQGMPLVVRRVFLSAQVQWAEVEVGSTLGYMVAIEIDLS